MKNIIQAMTNILFEELEGGIAIGEGDCGDLEEQVYAIDVKLCLVLRFITEGMLDFSAMQQNYGSAVKIRKGSIYKRVRCVLP